MSSGGAARQRRRGSARGPEQADASDHEADASEVPDTKPILDKVHGFSVVYPGAFTAVECSDILRLAGPPSEAGLVSSSSGPGLRRDSARVTRVRTVPRSDERLRWAYARVRVLAEEANRLAWRLGPLRDAEALNIAGYAAGGHAVAAAEATGAAEGEGKIYADGYYDWHVDQTPDAYAEEGRVLSVSVQLSAPPAYRGGGLALGPRLAPRGLGDVIIFPSYLAHCVFPVTEGERFSMVVWIRGNLGGSDFTDRALKAHLRAIDDRAGWAALARLAASASSSSSSPPSSSRGSKAEASSATSDHVPFGVRYLLGTHLLRTGEAVSAIDILRPLASEDPFRSGVLNNLAVAQFYAADKAGAIRTLRRAAKERPADGEVHTNLGKFLLAEGYLFAAARSLGRAVVMGHPSAITFVACGVMAFVIFFSTGMLLFMWLIFPRLHPML